MLPNPTAFLMNRNGRGIAPFFIGSLTASGVVKTFDGSPLSMTTSPGRKVSETLVSSTESLDKLVARSVQESKSFESNEGLDTVSPLKQTSVMQTRQVVGGLKKRSSSSNLLANTNSTSMTMSGPDSQLSGFRQSPTLEEVWTDIDNKSNGSLLIDGKRCLVMTNTKKPKVIGEFSSGKFRAVKT